MAALYTQSATVRAPLADPRFVERDRVPHVRIVRADPTPRQEVRWIKDGDLKCRAINVVVAIVGILVTAPIMLVIAALVRLSSPGPVFYKQQRVGLNRRAGSDRRGTNGRARTEGRRASDKGGRIFTIYKFRTMRAATGPQTQVWASQSDPRITRVGAVLRKYRLDELPQLFNVLLGDMNIVGPRPEQPEIFGRLKHSIDRYGERQRVLPGITGWAQVNHHYDQSIEDVKTKVAFDLEYIHGRSALSDLKIMALTFPVMIGRRGAI